MKNFILLGIGNPGALYCNTRHNAGSIVLQELITLYNKQLDLIPQFIMEEHNFYCLMNISYVNTTGISLGPQMNKWNVDNKHLVVFHDNLDLPVGQWNYKFSSGTCGHKGLKSIKSLLQESSFHKISIGIDRPSNDDEVSQYVLQTMDTKTIKILKELALDIYHKKILEKIINSSK